MLRNQWRNNSVINRRTRITRGWNTGNVERWSAQLRNNIACDIAEHYGAARKVLLTLCTYTRTRTNTYVSAVCIAEARWKIVDLDSPSRTRTSNTLRNKAGWSRGKSRRERADVSLPGGKRRRWKNGRKAKDAAVSEIRR